MVLQVVENKVTLKCNSATSFSEILCEVLAVSEDPEQDDLLRAHGSILS